MTLAADLDGHEPSLTVAEILDRLEDDERDALHRALTDRKAQRADGQPLYRWSERDLSKRLVDEGWRVSPYKIRRWRQANVTS